MKLAVYNNYDELSAAAAELVMEQVKSKPGSLLCFPSGESPTGMFRHLVQLAQTGKIDFSQCSFIGLDEWLGMDENNEGSCKHYMYHHFFDPLKIPPAQIIFFDALTTDLEGECERINEVINRHGGLDLMMVGVGMNGHLGLNEPGTDFDSYAHRSTLDNTTVKVGQKYFKEQTTLKEGITLGLRHLKEAKKAVLIASGVKKAAIVAEGLQGEVSTSVPASILQTIPGAIVLLDKDAATVLKGSFDKV